MDERVGNPWQALLALLLVLGFSLIGTVGPAEGEECAKIHQVEITFGIATGFKPYTMVIQVGDCIRWVNVHGIEHSAVAVDRSFHTGTLMPGSSALIEFDKTGVYPYTCGPHPPMVGKVIVEPAHAPSQAE